jgi:hypothetical protein
VLAVNPLEMFNDPAKELEPVPLEVNNDALAVPPTSKLPDTDAIPTILTLLLDASMEKMFEILAVIPELDAISKYASGVMSPSPNLPEEIDENLAKAVERELLATMSLVKV